MNIFKTITVKYFLCCLTMVFVFATHLSFSQIPLPQNLPQARPRFLTNDTKKQIEDQQWAQDVVQGIQSRIDHHVHRHQTDPEWMVSRLMMYWKRKATQVFINGGVYVGAEGEAPVPTPRFGSTRGVSSPIRRPKLEDIVPYMDDTKGVFFHNTAKEGSPLEWADPANVSGGQIESINREIIGHGRDAAFMYWLNNDESYARFAYDIFNTYMSGMYYRNEPIDMGKGHAQTLVGLSTFEVIQESILSDLALYYDFLHRYIKANHSDKLSVFEATFKKWIDITIKNGVPHNNWNLHQANFILNVAMVLEDDIHYADGKGREFYINHVLNVTTPRQWSLLKLMEFGYDFNNGIWNESANYSQIVTNEFMHFIRRFDNTFQMNLLPFVPVMYKAVEVLPQYIFPNGQISAFGDSYYSPLSTNSVADMIRMSQRYKDVENERRFTAMYKAFNPNAGKENLYRRPVPQISAFLNESPLVLNPDMPAGKVSDYLTQTFYAPNVSWLVQRNGRDKEHGLMVTKTGSYGNHMHANGISIELYGKGFVLGAESGIGSSYFEKPYLEYYSQFPAHNTVMVDGISKYPEMLSNHPFDLLSSYPLSGRKNGYFPNITFSEVFFLEPETRSDQQRFVSIIRTSDTTGYYVDVFRSKRQRGGDKFHDYFYHNLGQSLKLTDVDGNRLKLYPNEEMAFAGGHLFALDYMWDKKSVKTNDDYKAVWDMNFPDGKTISMNLWMKGYPGREVFTIKSPSCKAFRGNHGIPYEIDKEPFLKISARQHGAAWDRPFVSVFEPSDSKTGVSIKSIRGLEFDNVPNDFVAIEVTSKSGRKDRIFSSARNERLNLGDVEIHATYAVVSEHGEDFVLFMGNGTRLKALGFTIVSATPTTAVIEHKNGKYYMTADAPVTIKRRMSRLRFGEHKNWGELKF